MSLEQPLRDVEAELAALARVAGSTPAWADQQRQAFDKGTMAPLDQAGRRMLAALGRAQEQCARAEQLLLQG